MSSWSTGIDLSISFRPLEEHRQELTNTVAGRGNEGRGRGEDGEEAEKLLEHLDGLLRYEEWERQGDGKNDAKHVCSSAYPLVVWAGRIDFNKYLCFTNN